MSEWRTYTVKELVDLGVLERPIDGNHGSIHPKTVDFVNAGIPFIMASDLKGGRVDLSNCAFISEQQARGLAKGFSKAGDVLLSHKATIGRTAIVQENDFPYIMLTPQITYYRIKNPRKLNNRFLKYYFDSRSFLNIFEAWAGGGSTRAYLGITAQLGLPIPLPPLGVQQSIADLVGPLDDKIELNRRINETLEATARAIFKDWFVDFGPTRAKAEGNPPYLAPEIWSIFPDVLDENDRPAGWADKPLSAVIDLIGGGTPKTSVAEYWGGPIPWFSVVDAPNPSDVFVVKTEKSITPAGLESSSAHILPLGATIITARGTVGKLAMVGTEMAMNQSCYAINGKFGWPNSFIYFLVKTTVQTLQANTHGSVFDTITRQTFDAVSACCPTPQIAEAFGRSVDSMLDRIKTNLQENETLAQIRDLLLPKLMSGEIRLRDAEKIVEAAA